MTDGAPEYGPLIQQARADDPTAAPKLIEALYPLVIRIVRSHLPVRSSEEDLAQDVFIKLFAALNQYSAKPGIPFEHWVARVAVRTCLDALRAERRRPEKRWTDLSPSEAAWVDFMVAEQVAPPEDAPSDALAAIELLLGQLAARDRLVIHLLDLEEKSVKEVSAITGWSATMVKVQAFRARGKLRKLAAQLPKRTAYAQL